MPDSLDWDKLKTFFAAASTGSLTAAAERLKMSQSAASRQITALEEQLSTPLFHRHARGLTLTEQGQILYETVSEMAHKVSRAQTSVMDSRGKPQGRLRISSPISLGSNWLLSVLPEFMAEYPEINIQLILEDEEHDLSTMDVDCALRPWRSTQGDVIERKLGTISQSLYASDAYLAKNGAPSSLEDLDRHHIIAFGELIPKGMNSTNWILHRGRPADNPRKPLLEINNLHGVMRAAEAGIGIAGIPDYMVALSRRLVRVLPQVRDKGFDVYFVYPEELRGSVKLSVFREFMLDAAKRWARQGG